MTDRTLENSDPSAQHQDPDELNDQQQITRDAPNVPGADPVRFPSKPDHTSTGAPSSEIAAEEEKRQLETGEENPG